jgi:hypothetical protein
MHLKRRVQVNRGIACIKEEKMPDSQTSQIQTMLAAFGIAECIIALAGIAFTILVFWKIFSKAGYNGALGILMIVPIANIVMLCILAFSQWPILQELNRLRQQAMGMPQYPQYPQNPQNPQYAPYPQNPPYPRQ